MLARFIVGFLVTVLILIAIFFLKSGVLKIKVILNQTFLNTKLTSQQIQVSHNWYKELIAAVNGHKFYRRQLILINHSHKHT